MLISNSPEFEGIRNEAGRVMPDEATFLRHVLHRWRKQEPQSPETRGLQWRRTGPALRTGPHPPPLLSHLKRRTPCLAKIREIRQGGCEDYQKNDCRVPRSSTARWLHWSPRPEARPRRPTHFYCARLTHPWTFLGSLRDTSPDSEYEFQKEFLIILSIYINIFLSLKFFLPHKRNQLPCQQSISTRRS